MGGSDPVNLLTVNERFRFDLQGFVVLRNVLSHDHIEALNRAIDQHPEGLAWSTIGPGPSKTLVGSRRRQGFALDPLQLPKPDAEPFRDLVLNPVARRYLDTLLGSGWRLDSAPELIISDTGAQGMCLHGSGQRWFSPVTYYAYANDVIRCGMVTLEYALSPAGPGDGGFACIPGSHKANFACPPGVLKWEEETDLVQQVALEPGDLIVFSEALLHGTLPWRGKHQRRIVLLRYVPRVRCISPPTVAYHQTSYPEWIEQLPPEGRVPFEAPYLLNRPVLTTDNAVVTSSHWI
jgi:hypothetical protein